MSLNDNLSVLRQTPLFSQMGDEALRLLAFGAEPGECSKGQELYHEGDQADCAYVVISGEFDLLTKSKSGELISQGNADQATILGELALVSKTKRQFTVKALEPSRVLKINRDLFQRLMSEYPEIAEILRARIEANLRQLTSGLDVIARKFKSV